MMILQLVYILSAFLLAIYTLGHGVLLWNYLRHRNQPIHKPSLHEWPVVMVQLPIYNEQAVAQRLLEAVAAFDYPANKLHIQILDDSTDKTSYLIAQALYKYPHLQIQHLRRPNRDGYKAGALAYGLQESQSPYVAIFDADFVPEPNFLRETIPFLEADSRLAVVQSRWGHLNPDENWLTRAQVLSIDNHFLIEQTGRNRAGFFLPFNGTGGVWRVKAILDAGGWSDETLTEDLDLSFRAQLKGWQSLYLPDLVVKGEIPPQLAAFRQQQGRWAKGGSQAFRKLIFALWKADLPLGTKLMASQHLAQYMPHLLMLLMLLLTPPLLLSQKLASLPLAPVGLIGLIPPLMYIISQKALGGSWQRRLLAFPALLLIGTGLIAQNASSVLSGLVRMKGEFQRTPKFAEQWQESHYALRSQSLIEVFFMLYALWGAYLAWQSETALVPYCLLHALSFATVLLWEWRDSWQIKRVPKLMPESGND
jgi:cellulose synthase/poly-beta-1,6-N-acetylglucosamine synthase-like glycosyltransferase